MSQSAHHIGIVKRSGISPVVCINAFVKDTPAEIAKIRELCEAAGARVAVSRHWELGGEGAEELAQAVIEACEVLTELVPLYDWNAPSVNASKRSLSVSTALTVWIMLLRRSPSSSGLKAIPHSPISASAW